MRLHGHRQPRLTRALTILVCLTFLAGLIPGARMASARQDAPGARPGDPARITAGLQPRRCPVTGPVGEVEGRHYECGILVVPENHDDPDGQQIELTYARLFSTSLSPAPDPVIYLEGGPGGSAVVALDRYARIFADLRMTRDIVLLDQRGTKYSTRLDCTPYLVLMNQLVETDPGMQAIFDDALESGGDAALTEVQSEIYLGACAAGLIESGYDLSQYTSAASAKDVLALADALEYESINLYGISYGTRLALTIMRDAPETLRTVVLDSVYPPEVDGYELYPYQIDEAVGNLVSDCERDPACNAAYPDLREELRDLLNELSENQFSFARVESVLININRDPRVAPFVPRMVMELAEGSTETLDGIVSQELFDQPPIDTSTLTQAEELLLTAQELERDAESLLEAAAEEARKQRPGALFFTRLMETLDAMDRGEARDTAVLALYVVPITSRTPERSVFVEYINDFLIMPDEEREAMLAELDALDPHEVRFVYDLIGDVIDATNRTTLTDGIFYAVECHEEMPFNEVDDIEETLATLEFPELAISTVEFVNQTAAVCPHFLTGEYQEIETEPVISDVPTMVYAGAYDTQTPFSWGRLTADRLDNSFLVEFPSTGHGVIVFSRCARDIAEAFINNPTVEPATGCVDGLKPKFVVD